jgi:hypothetical protein
MSQVKEFIEDFPGFPAPYKDSLDMSKGKMRECIYKPEESSDMP